MSSTELNVTPHEVFRDPGFNGIPSDLGCDMILDAQPFSGSQNMALDAALLKTVINSDRCIVRIYTWKEPTISLGYFQQEQSAELPYGISSSIPKVRRLTGGGAILHDQELTYSCVLPRAHPVRHNPSALYRILHSAIVRLLKECGVECSLRGDLSDGPRESGKGMAAEPFLCFLRSDPNDIVCESSGNPGEQSRKCFKLVGSAQRRRSGTILQHGSILISGSTLTPDVPGILNLYPRFSLSRFRTELPWRLAAAVSQNASCRQYFPEELEVAAGFDRKSDY